MPELSGTPIDEATLLHLGSYSAGGLPLQFSDEVVDEGGTVRYLQTWKPDASLAHNACIRTRASGCSDTSPGSP